jgi:SAM-dependent methyltransferase
LTTDVFRSAMYEALRPFLEAQRDKFAEAAEVSGTALVDEFGFSGERVSNLRLPVYDLMAPPTHGPWAERAGTYDLVLIDQVLEHVPAPCTAIDRLRKLLRPGGWAVVTTVFMFPIHDDDTSGDYFRFSPRALRGLFPSTFWVEVRVGTWGSREALRHLAEWRKNNRDPALAGLAATNEPDVPIMVWAVARKAPERAPPEPHSGSRLGR